MSLANTLNTAFTPFFAANSSLVASSAAVNQSSLLNAAAVASGATGRTNPHLSLDAASSTRLQLAAASANYDNQNSLASNSMSGAVSNLGISLPVSPFRGNSSLQPQHCHGGGGIAGVSAQANSSLLQTGAASTVLGANVAGLSHMPTSSECYLSPISTRISTSGILDMTDSRRNSELVNLPIGFSSRFVQSPPISAVNSSTSRMFRQNSLADPRMASPITNVGVMGAASTSLLAAAIGSNTLGHLAPSSLDLLHSVGEASTSSGVPKISSSRNKMPIPSIKVERDSPPCEHTQEPIGATGNNGEGSPSSNNSIITLSSDEEDQKY